MKEYSLTTTKRRQFIDITAQVREAVVESRVREGLCVVYCPHTTAGITINEHADPDVVHDIDKTLERLVPRDGRYAHAEGNSDSHVKSSLFGPSLTVGSGEAVALFGPNGAGKTTLLREVARVLADAGITIDDDLDGSDARVTVRLDWDDRAFHGQALGTAGERVRLAGEAALDAVGRIVDGALDLELLAVATTDLGAASVALAQVRYGEDTVLIGSALQGEVDDRLAAVRAVMDAVNRKLETIL